MLITIIVRSGAKGYTVQHSCDDWDQLVPTLLASPPFREFCRSELAIPIARPLSPDEVFLFVPMDPLVETWLAQGGREGKYFDAICVRTAEGDYDHDNP
jgi:hypothetical protein